MYVVLKTKRDGGNEKKSNVVVENVMTRKIICKYQGDENERSLSLIDNTSLRVYSLTENAVIYCLNLLEKLCNTVYACYMRCQCIYI